jgi:hypothetical protein
MTFSLHPIETAESTGSHAVNVVIDPALTNRNRITCAFRPILAIPHAILVGAPTAFGITLGWRLREGLNVDWGAGTGVLGLLAGVVAFIAWFAILFTGEYPRGLWQLAAFYIRWRTRAIAYMALLRDEYPPFGDADYPAHVDVAMPEGPRDRVTTAFRIFLLIPHFIVLWLLSVVWLLTSIVAWLAILFTGRFPDSLYRFGCGVLRWSIRVEAYLLLLHDEYPPFALE